MSFISNAYCVLRFPAIVCEIFTKSLENNRNVGSILDKERNTHGVGKIILSPVSGLQQEQLSDSMRWRWAMFILFSTHTEMVDEHEYCSTNSRHAANVQAT